MPSYCSSQADPLVQTATHKKHPTDTHAPSQEAGRAYPQLHSTHSLPSATKAKVTSGPAFHQNGVRVIVLLFWLGRPTSDQGPPPMPSY